MPGYETPFSDKNRRIIRAEENPLDKSTVISIFPKVIDERKPTIYPGHFVFGKGSYDNPAILVVGSSSWWRDLDPNQPALQIPNSSIQVANSIVVDYCNGLLGYRANEIQPGLFWIPGNLTVDQVKKDHKPLLDKAKTCQDNWYKEMVHIADILWARSNGNPLSISDDARLAVQELQLKDKPWMKDFTTLQLVNCPACGVLRNSNFPVCQHCHTVVDQAKFTALGLKFAAG